MLKWKRIVAPVLSTGSVTKAHFKEYGLNETARKGFCLGECGSRIFQGFLEIGCGAGRRGGGETYHSCFQNYSLKSWKAAGRCSFLVNE